MPLLNLMFVLILIGVIVYAINTMIPMDEGIKKIISFVGVIVALIYVFYAFGIISHLRTLTVPHL